MKSKEARSVARKAIRQVKNAWFQAKADEAQRQCFGGKVVWKCIQDMQRACRGLVPSKLITISDKNGEPCSTPASQEQCWRRHFTMVLNVRSQYQPAEMEKVRQREVDEDIGKTPSLAEVAKALGMLKNGKAPGSSDVLPEMLKMGCRNEDFMRLIVNMVEAVWKEKKVLQGWVDAILIPIPKKGSQHICDKWHGISLLEVMGKVVARMMQNRLQVRAERELP